MIDSLWSGELTVAYFVAFKVASSRQESQSMTHLDRSDINKDAQTLRIAYNSCLKYKLFILSLENLTVFHN